MADTLNQHTIRVMERASIRDFVQQNSHFLRGRVLDYGCGKPGTCPQPQPYKDIVLAAGGEYCPYDLGFKPLDGNFNTVLCTQVLQYVEDPQELLINLGQHTNHFVITYPTLWEEVERNDLWRFTKLGMERMLSKAGFQVVVHKIRWQLPHGDILFNGGYGVVASTR